MVKAILRAIGTFTIFPEQISRKSLKRDWGRSPGKINKALKGDWQKVGGDMWKAMGQVDKEITGETDRKI